MVGLSPSAVSADRQPRPSEREVRVARSAARSPVLVRLAPDGPPRQHQDHAFAFGDFVHGRLGGVECPQRRLRTQPVVAVIPTIGVHVQDRRRILRNPLRRWWRLSRRNNRFPGTGQAHKHHRSSALISLSVMEPLQVQTDAMMNAGVSRFILVSSYLARSWSRSSSGFRFSLRNGPALVVAPLRETVK